MHASLVLVRSDVQLYESIWKDELELEVETGGIQHLENVVRMLGVDAMPLHCRQYNRARVEELQKNTKQPRRIMFEADSKTFNPIFEGISPLYVPVPRTVRLQAPITTELDQLFAQAACVRIALIRKAKAWASGSNGMFALPQTELEQKRGDKPSFVKWAEVMHDARMDKLITDCWPPVKKRSVGLCSLNNLPVLRALDSRERTTDRMTNTAQRAIEKLLRLYHNDTSRLLDLARCQIVFETVGDLTMGLGLIATDSDVGLFLPAKGP